MNASNLVPPSISQCLLVAGCIFAGPGASGAESPARTPNRLIAQAHDSGFLMNHNTWNGMGVGSDGKVYYVLCSESIDRGAQMFCFNPATGRIRHLGDLTEACGEQGLKAIPQGKSHVTFVESDGKLYFATHMAYYNPLETADAKEKKATPRPATSPIRADTSWRTTWPGGPSIAWPPPRTAKEFWPWPWTSAAAGCTG